jgi:hypothetical protein
MSNNYFNRKVIVARIQEDGAIVDTHSESDNLISIDEVILDSAKNPKRVQGDAGSVEQHSLQDLIAVERFLASKKAANNTGIGIRLIKISPDGST